MLFGYRSDNVGSFPLFWTRGVRITERFDIYATVIGSAGYMESQTPIAGIFLPHITICERRTGSFELWAVAVERATPRQFFTKGVRIPSSLQSN